MSITGRYITMRGGNIIGTPPIISSIDPDAEAFLTAAAITDPTITSAIDTLVVQLKADGIWTKMKALYPFVGGTASTHKWNLKDPRDLDAAFRLVFSGGITHSSGGIQGNGVNGYYNTNFNLANNFSLSSGGSIFVQVATNISQTSIEIGGQQNTPSFIRTQIAPRWSDNNFYAAILSTSFYLVSNANSIGFYASTRLPNNNTGFYGIKDNTSAFVSNAYAEPNANVGGLCRLEGVTPTQFSSRTQIFSGISDGLTLSEIANLKTAINVFNTSLSRHV
jgi:hypothetical protein